MTDVGSRPLLHLSPSSLSGVVALKTRRYRRYLLGLHCRIAELFFLCDCQIKAYAKVHSIVPIQLKVPLCSLNRRVSSVPYGTQYRRARVQSFLFQEFVPLEFSLQCPVDFGD